MHMIDLVYVHDRFGIFVGISHGRFGIYKVDWYMCWYILAHMQNYACSGTDKIYKMQQMHPEKV